VIAMEIKKISKKGMEMTMPLLVSIIIGLVILAVILYLIWSRGQIVSASTGCDPELCKTGTETCPSGHDVGFVACSEEGTDGKKKFGRCCVPME